MGKVINITILFLACTSLLRAQSADSSDFKRVVVSTNLCDYFPTFLLNTANLNIGSEIYLKNRKSIGLSFGIVQSYGPSGGWLSVSAENTTGYKVQLEGRHYFNRQRIVEPLILIFWPHIFQYKSEKMSNAGYYASIHTFYQSTATERYENNIHPAHTYTVNRNLSSVNIKFGYQCIRKSGFTIDYAVGFGAKHISSEAIGLINSQNLSYSKDLGGKPFDEGEKTVPNVMYQVKIGWAF